MDLYEAIEKRRTIRSFVQPATEEAVRKIVKAGTRSMSAMNSQPWEFIIITDPSMIEKIAEEKYQLNLSVHSQAVAKLQKKAYFNSCVIAACYKEGPGHLWSMWACVQNMALAATAEGLGILPSTLWGRNLNKVEDLLKLPEGYSLATMVLIGKQRGHQRSTAPRILRREDFSWLHRNQFGGPV
jgi:nitroreductase